MDQKFTAILAAALKTEPSSLSGNPAIRSIPGWDSLSHWAVIGKLEEEYGIEFTMEEATCINYIEDVYRTILKKTAS